MSLLEYSDVAVGGGVGELVGQAQSTEPLVQHGTGCQVLVILENLLTQFVDQLVKTQIHLYVRNMTTGIYMYTASTAILH